MPITLWPSTLSGFQAFYRVNLRTKINTISRDIWEDSELLILSKISDWISCFVLVKQDFFVWNSKINVINYYINNYSYLYPKQFSQKCRLEAIEILFYITNSVNFILQNFACILEFFHFHLWPILKAKTGILLKDLWRLSNVTEIWGK